MKKFITILLAGMLVLGLVVPMGAAAEEKVVVKDVGFMGYTIEDVKSWDMEELYEKNKWWLGYGLGSKLLFQALHPNIEIQVVPWDWWGPEAAQLMIAALAAGEAPSYYICSDPSIGGVPGAIEKGLVADITDLVKDWEAAQLIPEAIWRTAWKSGRCYALPYGVYGAKIIGYRKDWFEEAGIFNAQGEPAPPDDWTWDDFIEIAKKLTNAKADRWGYSLPGEPMYGWIFDSSAFGSPLVRPDPSGKYTWQAAFNLPMGVEALQLYKDLVWKHKVVIPHPGGDFRAVREDFLGGRVGMLPYRSNDVFYYAWVHSDMFGPGTDWGKIVGMAPYPKGPQGIRLPGVEGNMWGINPTQTNEEIKASFECLKFKLDELARVDLLLQQIERPDFGYYAGQVYGLKVSGKLIDQLVGYPADYIRARNIAMNEDPLEPYMGDYGLWIPNTVAFNTALQAAISKIFTDPNADPKTELDKAADVANRTALNEKLEGVTKEDMKNYYTALSEFYEKEYPKYYGETFKQMFEEYFKVW